MIMKIRFGIICVFFVLIAQSRSQTPVQAATEIMELKNNLSPEMFEEFSRIVTAASSTGTKENLHTTTCTTQECLAAALRTPENARTLILKALALEQTDPALSEEAKKIISTALQIKSQDKHSGERGVLPFDGRRIKLVKPTSLATAASLQSPQSSAEPKIAPAETLPSNARSRPEFEAIRKNRPVIDGKEAERVADLTNEIKTGESTTGSGRITAERVAAAMHGGAAIYWSKPEPYKYSATSVGVTFTPETPPLQASELKQLYKSSSFIVHFGEVPQGPKFDEITQGFLGRTVIHEMGSANDTSEKITNAIELSNVRLSPNTTKIFNALPYERNGKCSQAELKRMRILGNRQAWESLNKQINALSVGWQSYAANKADILKELETGTNQDLIIYAHFDGTYLYLPGAEGEKISLSEIEAVRRREDSLAARRTIILAACGTAVKKNRI